MWLVTFGPSLTSRYFEPCNYWLFVFYMQEELDKIKSLDTRKTNNWGTWRNAPLDESLRHMRRHARAWSLASNGKVFRVCWLCLTHWVAFTLFNSLLRETILPVLSTLCDVQYQSSKVWINKLVVASYNQLLIQRQVLHINCWTCDHLSSKHCSHLNCF